MRKSYYLTEVLLFTAGIFIGLAARPSHTKCNDLLNRAVVWFKAAQDEDDSLYKATPSWVYEAKDYLKGRKQ